MNDVFGDEFVFDELKLTVLAEDVKVGKTKTTIPEMLDRSLQQELDNAINNATQNQLANLVESTIDKS